MRKRKFLDVLSNLFRQARAFIYFKRINQKKILPPEGYKLKFEDYFNEETLDKSKWRLGQPWGFFHPGNLSQYYDTEGKETYIDKEGLVLELKHRGIKIEKSKLSPWLQNADLPESFIIPNSVGLVSTLGAWQYGWFSAEIKLPKGKGLWPAFWLGGKYTWPPEIDIFEAYSKLTEDYQGSLLFMKIPHMRIQPNLHYGIVEDGSKKMWGSYNIPVSDATERFVQYVCHWEKDFIRIYYDGVMVFEVTDKRVLKWFNREEAEQFIIINNGVDDIGIHPDESKMVIKNVNVYQK